MIVSKPALCLCLSMFFNYNKYCKNNIGYDFFGAKLLNLQINNDVNQSRDKSD